MRLHANHFFLYTKVVEVSPANLPSTQLTAYFEHGYKMSVVLRRS